MTECAKSRLALARSFQECQQAMAALGDETRQQILMTLLESEQVGLRVGEIAAGTHLSRPAVSHHLKILKDADIIVMQSRGTMNFYYINADAPVWDKMNRLTTDICTIVNRAKDAGYPDNHRKEI